ncbi:MAG: DUF188 domain-containing protein [Treponema sp.]|nr:DUF188 domain-containing protein [Treponema sp.]
METASFTVWLDADSFPQKAREFALEHSFSKKIPVTFVANHEIKILPKYDNAKMIVCEKGQNSADNYIFENCGEYDIVLTRDIPFAARLVEKKIIVLNDRGVAFNKDNIEDKLREREFSLNMAQIGLGGNKGNYYGEKELKKFSRTFEEKIQENIIAVTYGVKKH